MKSNRYLPIIVFGAFSLIFGSCNKSTLSEGGEPTTVMINLASEEIDQQEQDFEPGANNESNTSSDIARTAVVRQELDMTEDFYIISELTPNEAILTTQRSAQSQAKRADIIRNPITRQIKFKLAVYNAAGNYVLDKVYSISAAGAVTADDGQPLTIDRGNYYFIAYSYNTNTAPSENLTTTTINSSLPVNPATFPQFLMYNSGLITISPGQNNALNIALEYKFSPVQVIVDATLTNGYNITSVGTTTVASSRTGSNISLLNGTVTFTGSTTTTPTFTFPTPINAPTVTSNVVWMANNITNGTLSLASLVVGPLNRTTPIPVPNVRIQPGFGYTLRVTLTPNDKFEIISDQPAALIAGRYWMRGNLGVTGTNFDQPDANGSFQALLGNYYQWGKPAVRATNTTGATAPQSNPTTIWTSAAAAGSWYTTAGNTGGKVVANDPCPTGWRVPTRTELDNLIAATTQLTADNRGTDWDFTATNYSTAKVFRSRRDRNVILTFPTSGSYSSTRALNARGEQGFYWSSTDDPANTATNAGRMAISQTGVSTGVGTNNKTFAISVRCTQAVL